MSWRPMVMSRSRLVVVSLAVAAGAGAPACCGVGRVNMPVQFAGQQNIIVWDPVSKTEHFIRNAKFNVRDSQFGFIAPTPTEPDLAESKEAAYMLLEALDPRPKKEPDAYHYAGASGGAGQAGAVEVIKEQEVSGYQAVVLKATDAKALADWLTVNQFVTTEATTDWLDFYVKKGWYLTAFKVKRNAAMPSTGIIRMSFKTQEPYNPYFVPLDNIPKRYLLADRLSVLFVAPGRYQASIGYAAPWEATKLWNVPLPNDQRAPLAKALDLKESDIPANSAVTSYLDERFPRNVWDDLYFSRIPEHSLIPGWGGGFFSEWMGPEGILLHRTRS